MRASGSTCDPGGGVLRGTGLLLVLGVPWEITKATRGTATGLGADRASIWGMQMK